MGARHRRLGLSVIPLSLYLKDSRAKVELGLVRGRKQYDKRQVIAKRDADRDMQRAMRHPRSLKHDQVRKLNQPSRRTLRRSITTMPRSVSRRAATASRR